MDPLRFGRRYVTQDLSSLRTSPPPSGGLSPRRIVHHGRCPSTGFARSHGRSHGRLHGGCRGKVRAPPTVLLSPSRGSARLPRQYWKTKRRSCGFSIRTRDLGMKSGRKLTRRRRPCVVKIMHAICGAGRSTASRLKRTRTRTQWRGLNLFVIVNRRTSWPSWGDPLSLWLRWDVWNRVAIEFL